MSGEWAILRDRGFFFEVSLHSSHRYPSTEYEKYLCRYFERLPSLILGWSSTERMPSVSPQLVETWLHLVQVVEESSVKLVNASKNEKVLMTGLASRLLKFVFCTHCSGSCSRNRPISHVSCSSGSAWPPWDHPSVYCQIVQRRDGKYLLVLKTSCIFVNALVRSDELPAQ